MDEALVDTDVLIDHLRGARAVEAASGTCWSYSVITRCELFAGNDPKRVLHALLGRGQELLVTSTIAERAGHLRRVTGLATPDVLIAATALEHDLPLVTRNVKHFERIPELRLVVPT